jgi:ketosteroid isomerase-like protein/catechol 2,3-dioxygenase-like lactoylglutathione lyase family enzyme
MSSENAARLREGFEAFLRGDFDALRELLAPDAQWLWFAPNPGDCQGRERILETLRARQRQGVVTGLDEILEGGEKLVLHVAGGRVCLVVTMRDGRIVRIQDHPSREAALFDAGLAGRAPRERPAPVESPEPGSDTVHALVPFVHVRDVQASIAFYEHLGFRVTATFPPSAPVPGWAWLKADEAQLMLQHADQPILARSQGVLFYLYSRDLFGLRERLLAAGIAAGEIVDGSPGPEAEMRVTDPDGYVLMIAQTTD